ncbi:hypothetical protein D3C72_2292650 [compost metagenome]
MLADSLDAQAFSPSLAHQDGIEFAALYTLQHSLAGHAEQLGCFLHDDVAIGAVRDELLQQRIGDADAPGRTGRGLFAGDKAVVDPTV